MVNLNLAFVDVDPMTLAADELAKLIEFHNDRYWHDNAAVIPDQQYDKLVERLRHLQADHPLLRSLGETAPPDGEAKVAHEPPMLSLGKCYSEDELLNWAKSYDGLLVASPKVDGAACAIAYDAKGHLDVAGTRGDGARGEDVTRNVAGLSNVPRRLPRELVEGKGRIEVRGEVYMRLSRFTAIEDLYANPRNVAAGSLKAKEAGAVSPSELSFFAYDLLGWPVSSEKEKARVLQSLGFEPAPIEVCAVQQAEAIYQRMVAERSGYDYETDGVVFKIDDLDEQARRGATAHHPRWALAYKFQGDSGEARLEAVQWSVSRTGTITPVAIVEPVELSGATVTRATLHNLSTVRALELKIGDTLLMTRRGGVIPHVEGTLGGGTALVEPPQQCPDCASSTVTRTSTRRVGGEDIETVTLHCASPSECPSVQRGVILHYTKVLEIDGFGDKVVDLLLQRRLIGGPADLYSLSVEDLSELPRLGRASAENLVDQVRAARRVELATFLVALGIDTLGKHAAGLIASRWQLDEVRALDEAELADLHSLGDITAKRIVAGLAQLSPMIDRLLDHVEVYRPSAARTSDAPLHGEVIVFTGALEKMTRRDAQQLVTRMGARAGASVTRETTIVVVGGEGLRAAKPSSKLKKAQKLIASGAALRLVAEADFLAEIT